MGFEGAGYLPAGAGEVYGADVFGFGHDGDGRDVRGQSSLGFFLRVSKCVAVKWEERTVPPGSRKAAVQFIQGILRYCRQTGGVTLT